MNKRRRNSLIHLLDDLERLRDPVSKEVAIVILQNAQSTLEKCADEEEEALDNRPEAFMWSAANEDMAENISDLSEVSGDIEVVIDRCDDMDEFCYVTIKADMIKIVNKIKQVIHR